MRLNKLLLATGIIAFNKVLMLPRIVRGAQLLVSVQADDSGFIGEIPHGEKDHEELHSGGHALDPPFSYEWWRDAIVALSCAAISALMSGLTVGLIGLDKLTLEINAELDPKAKKQRDAIYPVVSKHHWMLVTLMFINAIVMETLPIYVDKMVPELLAISICVFLELVAGEVLPMAICSGPSQVRIAEICSPLVMFLMWLTSPISWPVAKMLDAALGEHKVYRFDNQQLKALIMLHSKEAMEEAFHHHVPENMTGLDNQTQNMLQGALTLHKVNVESVMTPIEKVDCLYMTSTLTQQCRKELLAKKHSRIPVMYNDQCKIIVGYFHLKSLLNVQTSSKTIAELFATGVLKLRVPIYVARTANMKSTKDQMEKGVALFAVICQDLDGAALLCQTADSLQQEAKMMRKQQNTANSFNERNLMELAKVQTVGIVTLTDVISKILCLDIDGPDAKDIKKPATHHHGHAHDGANKVDLDTTIGVHGVYKSKFLTLFQNRIADNNPDLSVLLTHNNSL